MNFWVLLKVMLLAPLSSYLVIENDSLLVVNSLSPHGDYYCEFGALSSHFLSNLGPSSTIFSNVLRLGNYLTHLIAKTALRSVVPLEWYRNISFDVTRAILFDFNNKTINYTREFVYYNTKKKFFISFFSPKI